MVALAEMGAIIAPPIPGFYHHPETILDLVDHSVDRVLDLLGLPSQRRAAGTARRSGVKRKPPAQTVAFQGERGAFSEEAAPKLLGARSRCCPASASKTSSARSTEESADGVIPIENTLHGSVHENYDHLLHFDLPIVGETSVRIVHNLIAPPGVPFAKIHRVFSHPVALNQCLDFFARIHEWSASRSTTPQAA